MKPNGSTRIVIDTNILISAVVGKFGFPYKILNELVLNGFFIPCFSPATVGEALRVSSYPRLLKKHPFLSEGMFELIENLRPGAIFVNPKKELKVIKDESDNRFLEVAVAAKAEFLITGNTNDFVFDEYEGIQIVSSRTFYERFAPHQ